MKIKLVETGGFLPVTKESHIDVALLDEELADLISKIKVNPSTENTARDAVYHIVEINGEDIPVDLNKVPTQYKEIFDSLRKRLSVNKF